MSKLQKKLLFWLALLLVACPIGLIVPDLLHSGVPWGEWDKMTIEKKTGFIPKGMKKDAELWNAPVKDYTIKENNSLLQSSTQYILSGMIGVGLIGLLTIGLTRIIHRNEKTP